MTNDCHYINISIHNYVEFNNKKIKHARIGQVNS